MVQRENNLDEQQTKLYVEAMQRTRISEILAYLIAAGLSLVYQGPTHLVQRLVLGKANSCLLSFLVFARYQRGWSNAILKTLDPAGALKLNAQLAENIESMLAWIYSAWINVSGIMKTKHYPDPRNQRSDDKNLPGFLFPSQIASLMLVETEDLIPVIAPVIWPIFGPMMALRFPTQPLRIAASSPTLSLLHFVDPQDNARPPEFQTLVHNFANFRPPMAYTVVKDKKQVEHNFATLIRARARCAIPMPMELHPIEWLHAPINPGTGALLDFAGWDEPGILRVLANAIQRLGWRRKGSASERLQHQNIQDVSRMYNPRTRPLDNTALALTNITCWANPPLVDQTIYRSYQMLNAIIPKIAKEPQRKVLPISAEAPSNPKMAMEIFMKLVAKQQEEGSSVCADYLTAIETYKEIRAPRPCQPATGTMPGGLCLRKTDDETGRKPCQWQHNIPSTHIDSGRHLTSRHGNEHGHLHLRRQSRQSSIREQLHRSRQ